MIGLDNSLVPSRPSVFFTCRKNALKDRGRVLLLKTCRCVTIVRVNNWLKNEDIEIISTRQYQINTCTIILIHVYTVQVLIYIAEVIAIN